ncbi:MAG: hypothetical protein HZC37_21030 [Burkholderiales bacterium]|nr:hypothetical protein [Burkholderiales bacterium]
MQIYSAPADLMLRHWDGEATAVARLPEAGTTHLIGSEALAVVQTVLESREGLALRDIAHALGLVADGDDAIDAGLQRIIDGLVQSGLLRRLTDDAEPGREGPR